MGQELGEEVSGSTAREHCESSLVTVWACKLPHIQTVLMKILVCVCVCVKLFSRIRCFGTPWTVAHQAPLSLEFPRQEYWSRLSFPSPGDVPDPGIEPISSLSAGRFFTTEPPGKPNQNSMALTQNRRIG